jgi:hypothetical protein
MMVRTDNEYYAWSGRLERKPGGHFHFRGRSRLVGLSRIVRIHSRERVLRTGRSHETLGSAIYGRVLKPMPEDQSSNRTMPLLCPESNKGYEEMGKVP